jgi:hypothetical protein
LQTTRVAPSEQKIAKVPSTAALSNSETLQIARSAIGDSEFDRRRRRKRALVKTIAE